PDPDSPWADDRRTGLPVRVRTRPLARHDRDRVQMLEAVDVLGGRRPLLAAAVAEHAGGDDSGGVPWDVPDRGDGPQRGPRHDAAVRVRRVPGRRFTPDR